MRRIPRIIHQMWSDDDPPPHLRAYMSSWCRLHPGWEVWLWTDADIEMLVRDRYPTLLRWFERAPRDVLRFDLSRYLILFTYGGVYADADYEPYRPFDAVTATTGLLLGWEWRGSPQVDRRHGAWRCRAAVAEAEAAGFTLGNAIMASAPGHPLWIEVVRWTVGHRPSSALAAEHVWDLSGPAALTRALARIWRDQWLIRLLSSDQLYPIGWHPPSLDDGHRASDFPIAFGAHHWAGTWWLPQPAEIDPRPAASLGHRPPGPASASGRRRGDPSLDQRKVRGRGTWGAMLGTNDERTSSNSSSNSTNSATMSVADSGVK